MNPYKKSRIERASLYYLALKEAEAEARRCRDYLLEALQEAREAEATQAEIAEGLGLSRQRISQLLRSRDGKN